MRRMRSSVGVKLLVIAGLSLALLIPAFMVGDVIREREMTRNKAVMEIGEKWGGKQQIAGPILTIPLRKQLKDDKGNVITSIRYAHFLPDTLNIKGNVSSHVLHRGIYEAVLYKSKLNVTGTFSFPVIEGPDIAREDVMWKDAFLSLGITDMKGIRDSINIKWDHADFTANPGIESSDVLVSGVGAKVPLAETKKSYSFSINVDLNGSQEIKFIPVGKETGISITSNWPAPSFQGSYLPEKREVSKKGFTAEWKILHLNRNYPQKWLNKSYDIYPSALGINLIMPNDEYQKTTRTIKYALLFISLTFMSFFSIESLYKKTLHPIQYLLVGFALVLFYTLLLSLSEHIAFGYSYLIASVSTTVMITAYSKSMLSSKFFASAICCLLSVLYGFLYVLLQVEDYALLLGSIGLFAVLGLFMYLTRKIDWYSVIKPEGEDGNE